MPAVMPSIIMKSAWLSKRIPDNVIREIILHNLILFSEKQVAS